MKTVFKLTKLSILVLALIAFSCKKDDEPQIVEINLQNLEVTIAENPTDGQVIGSVEADGGATSGFKITTQTPSGALRIDSDSGAITVANAGMFDFEAHTSITATVTANNATNTATVTVNLTNINEVSAQDLEVAMDENPLAGQSVAMIDVDGEGTLSFSIVSQTPQGALNIDANSGEVTVADVGLFDFEVNPVITATVSIDNSTTTIMSTVTVNLNDLDEISAQDLTITLDENPTDGQVVGTVQVNGGGTLDFSITSQNPTGALNINGSTGELTVADPTLFDFEANQVITATILADNTVSTTTSTVTINLNDVDEIIVQNANLTIDENPSNGATIGMLSATGTGSLAYSITFQNPAGAFDIDQNTGELSVADETLFDFETNPDMLATISVTDGVSSVSANAFVGLNDVNEVGEFKYGGVIFWINPTSNNSAGLVCAISDQGTNVPWGCQGTTISGTSQAIGSGASNTATILAGCTTSGIAADIASSTTIDNYSDWFLPSRYELHQMYVQRALINATAVANGGTAFIDSNLSTRYWSSSESNGNTAWCKVFGNGTDQGLNKGAAAYFQVRVVRAWTDF